MSRKKYAKKGTATRFAEWAAMSQTDDCVLWPLAHGGRGYPRIRRHGKTIYAHRYILGLATGDVGEGMFCAHAPGICHTPLCVNPRHLRWATAKENQDDRVADGTHNIGSQNPMSKLSEADVVAIFYAEGTHRPIAERFGVSPGVVSAIKLGKTWKTVTEPLLAA